MFYKKLLINETEYPIAVNITGMGAPTPEVKAEVGMFYMDESNGKVYKLTPEGWEGIVTAELDEKQDKLPENIGSSSHRMLIATPQKEFFEKDGVSYSGFVIDKTKYDEFMAEDATKDSVVEYEGKYYFVKPFHLKRLNTLTGNQGVITYSNYKQKAKELGKTEEWALGQIISHEEPSDFSIAVRLPNGQLVVESGTQPYVAVNNKKLEERLSEETEKLSDDILAERWNCKKTDNLIADKGRWYTIAESRFRTYPESFLRILVSSTPNYYVTQIVCNVSALEYNANSSSIGIISVDNRHYGDAITKMRIVANQYNINSVEKGALPLELQIYVPPFEREGEMLPFYIHVEDMGKGELYSWDVVKPRVSDELIETRQVAYLIDNVSEAPILGRNVATIPYVEAELEAIKAMIKEPQTEYKWVGLMGILNELDEASLALVTKNATKYKAVGCLYDTEKYEISDSVFTSYDWDFIYFILEIELDKIGGENGNVTNIKIDGFPEGFTLNNVSATRANVYSNIYYDEYFDYEETNEVNEYDAGVAFEFTIDFTDAEGNEHSETHSTLIRMHYGIHSADGCLASLEAYIPKNSETEQFFTETASTYDMRTQSIDRRLSALIEEARARRKNNSST